MRLGFCLACFAAAGLAACSEARIEQAQAEFGCAPVEGIKQISGRGQPGYIIVGEFTETSEAPAAFAEIACNLAAGGKLFVGLSEYLGGATDAETRMRERLDGLIAKGAPITVAVISDQNREWNPRNRTATEARWAEGIQAKIGLSGASHALLLVSHTDARASPYARGERFAGYDPMPMHLPEGQVMSLEIGSAPTPGLTAPVVRLYPAMTEGFHGQIALASLTRPMVALLMPDPMGRSRAEAAGEIMGGSASTADSRIYPFSVSMEQLRALTSPAMTREQKIVILTAFIEAQYRMAPDQLNDLPSLKQLRAPPRKLAEILVDDLSRAGSPTPDTGRKLEIPEPQINLPEFQAEDPAPN